MYIYVFVIEPGYPSTSATWLDWALCRTEAWWLGHRLIDVLFPLMCCRFGSFWGNPIFPYGPFWTENGSAAKHKDEFPVTLVTCEFPRARLDCQRLYYIIILIVAAVFFVCLVSSNLGQLVVGNAW